MLRPAQILVLCALAGSCATPPPAAVDSMVLVGTWKVSSGRAFLAYWSAVKE